MSARTYSKEWPEEKVALLLKLAKDGKSSSEIADRLGGRTTRNAVIGKLMRLEQAGHAVERRGALLKQGSAPDKGAAARPQPSLANVAVSNLALTKRGRPAYSKLIGPVVTKPLPAKPVEPVPFTNGARITLMMLTSKTCKWPLGDPREADFCFCGHKPRHKSPYCDYHARAACQPLQERARARQFPPLPLPNFNGLSK